MSVRKTPFVNKEFYHIYNRGVDKRSIFKEKQDVERFMQSIQEFNVVEPIGSIYENSFIKKQLGSKASKPKKLVNIVAYCLNPNHYHFIIEQVTDKGIEKFMQRLGTGYTKYFNNKNKRSGVLFQGKFKAAHINSNEYLLHLSVYVNLNNKAHQLGSKASKLVESSWGEYTMNGKKSGGTKYNNRESFCKKDIILGQFNKVSDYKQFAKSSLRDIIERKKELGDLEKLFLE